MSKLVINRRDFLKKSTLLSGGLLLSFAIPVAGRLGKTLPPEPSTGFTPNAFLHIASDNRITILLTHVEMGQGIWTTLPMLLAEELDADWKDIEVKHGPAAKAFNHAAFGLQITGGSSSTWSEFDRYRQVGATARILLTQAAAKRLGVAVEHCQTEAGFVIAGDKKLSYGELAQEAAVLPIPTNVPLRPASDWKYVGKGIKRLDSSVKTNGTAQFSMDVQYPGLLTAVVAHAPVFGGKVKSFDATKAKAMPGVRQVVEIPTGVAVLADHFWAASQGRNALNVVWDDGEGVHLSTSSQVAAYRKLASMNGLPADQKGDPAHGFAQSAKTIEVEYVFPYLAHAPMEPLNCTVKVSKNHCDIWTGTQLAQVDQAAAAKILGLSTEQVMINNQFLGGSFGRRCSPDADLVSEAVHIAKASNQFIKLVWTREDDMKGGHYRPAYVHKAKAGIGVNGLPIVWHHNVAGQSIMGQTSVKTAGVGALREDGIDLSSIEGVAGSPYLSAVPDYFVGLHSTNEVIPVLWFRSVGNTHTAYVMETMIDELAHLAGQDPVAYRRLLLNDHSRHLATLNLVAEKAGWGKPLPSGHYQGIAVHEAFGSCVAQVVEVSVNKGQLKVHRVTCAIDCGQAVNPDGIRAQMESGILFGLTMALYGELTIDKGQLQQNNFYDYKIARIHESPLIDVHLVVGKEKISGAGECGVPPLAPALTNALFAATGKRVYNLPLMNNGFSTAPAA